MKWLRQVHMRTRGAFLAVLVGVVLGIWLGHLSFASPAVLVVGSPTEVPATSPSPGCLTSCPSSSTSSPARTTNRPGRQPSGAP